MQLTVHRQLLWGLYERASHLHVHGVHGQEVCRRGCVAGRRRLVCRTTDSLTSVVYMPFSQLSGYDLEEMGSHTGRYLRAGGPGGRAWPDVSIRCPSHHPSRCVGRCLARITNFMASRLTLPLLFLGIFAVLPFRRQTFEHSGELARADQALRLWSFRRADQQHCRYLCRDEYLHERE